MARLVDHCVVEFGQERFSVRDRGSYSPDSAVAEMSKLSWTQGIVVCGGGEMIPSPLRGNPAELFPGALGTDTLPNSNHFPWILTVRITKQVS